MFIESRILQVSCKGKVKPQGFTYFERDRKHYDSKNIPKLSSFLNEKKNHTHYIVNIIALFYTM